jgi:hypothetical protein
MRYRLRTLLIAAAILPPILALLSLWGWREYLAWRNMQFAAPSERLRREISEYGNDQNWKR